MAKKYEVCFLCEGRTGRAGRTDDSIYDEQGYGPYCEECYKKTAEHKLEGHETEMESLKAELSKANEAKAELLAVCERAAAHISLMRTKGFETQHTNAACKELEKTVAKYSQPQPENQP